MFASPKSRPKAAASATQAKLAQRVMFDLLMKEDEKSSVRAQCARVWCLLYDARRIMAMKPMPKSVDPDKWNAARHKAKPPQAAMHPEDEPVQEPAKPKPTQ